MRELFQTANRYQFEDRCRAQTFATYCGKGVSLCRVFGRALLYVPSDDFGVAPWLMSAGCWEPWVTVAMGRLILPGWRCVDVGANVGYFTALMALLAGDTGTVVAVEPNDKVFRLLERNAQVNGFAQRAHLFHCCAGADDREDWLRVQDRNPASGSIVRAPDADDPTRQPTPVRPLDDLLDGPIDLLKIDAEGSDYDVLAGAANLLAASPDCVVFLEHDPRFYHDHAAKLDWLLSAGWSLSHVAYNGDIEPISKEGIVGSDRRHWDLVLRRGPCVSVS